MRRRDDAGHVVTSPVSRTVTVRDDVEPTLVLQGPASQVLECPTPFTEPGYVANDACTGDLTGSVQISGSVTAGTPGTYPLTYTVTDSSGLSAPPATRTVTVQDTQRPQVTLNGQLDITLECGAGSYTDQGATASDACAGPLTAVPSTTANPGAPGNYVITYTATDPSGNVGTSATSRTVHVVDSIAPHDLAHRREQDAGVRLALERSGRDGQRPVRGQPGGVGQRHGEQPAARSAEPHLHGDRWHQPGDDDARGDGERHAGAQPDVNGSANDTFACGGTYVDPGATATDACDPNVTVTATPRVTRASRAPSPSPTRRVTRPTTWSPRR